MNESLIEKIMNPFIRIAGAKALLWGLAGLLLSSFLSWLSGYHYHGLLHFGPAPNPASWCYLAEHIIVWLVPALLFYAGGLLFSQSRIRFVDILGTVLFAELPLLGMNLINLLPPMKLLSQIEMGVSPETVMAQPGFVWAMVLSILGLPFLVLALIWMIKALKISCNLKGLHLWLIGLIGIVGGDVICRFLIGYLY